MRTPWDNMGTAAVKMHDCHRCGNAVYAGLVHHCPTALRLDAGSNAERELRGVWLSRVMFGGLVVSELQPLYVETRSYEDWLTAAGYSLV